MKRAFIIMFCWVFVSCAVSQEVKKDLGPESAGPSPADEQDLIVEKIVTYNGELASLKASAIVVFRDVESTLSFRSEISAVEKTDYVRLDLMDLVFKTPLATILKNRDDVYTYVHQKGEYYEDTVSDADFGTLLGFDVPVKLLLSSLLARIYLPDGELKARMIDERQLEIVTLYENEVIRFGATNLPETIEYTKNDGQVYIVSFEQFEQKGSLLFPLVIKIKGMGRSLEIRYTSIEPNTAISGALFSPGKNDLEGYEKRD